MKAQSKAIVASLVVLVLAVCAVSGATYSWFSDTDNTDIEVTSGSIDLEMNERSVESYFHVGVDIASDGTAMGVDLGTNNVVTVSGMAPGDILTLKFTGTLNNSINAVLWFSTDVTPPEGLASPFIISNNYLVNGQVNTGSTVVPSDSGHDVISTVTIKMENVDNVYAGKTSIIRLNFSAYQANTPDSALPQNSVINSKSGSIADDGSLNISVPTYTNSNIGDVSLNIPAGSADGGTDVVVSAVSGATNEDASYVAVMEEYGSIIGGVNVSGVDSISGVSTIKFTIAGNYSGSKLAIYHEGEKLTYVNATPSQNGQFTTSYSDVDGVTTVTICASEFSTYYAVAVDPVASIGNVKYYTLQEAFDNGGYVKLLRNELVSKTLTVNKDVTFDTNGYVLSGLFSESSTSALIRNYGELTILGDGKIVYLAEHPDTDWYPEGFPGYASNLVSNNGKLIVKGSVTLENQTPGGGASYVISQGHQDVDINDVNF